MHWGKEEGSVFLSSGFPYGKWSVAQLLSLSFGKDICLHPFLDKLKSPLVFEDLEPVP